GATRVVLDARHLGGDAELVPLEVDLAQHALVPAAPVTHGDAPVGVPSVRALLGGKQAFLRRLLGDLLVGEERLGAARRRGGLERADSHSPRLPRPARSCGRPAGSPPPSSSRGGGLRTCPCASTSLRGRRCAPWRP